MNFLSISWTRDESGVIPLGKYKQTVKKLLGNIIYHTYLPLLKTFSFIAKNDDEMLVQSKCIACFLFEGICLPNISYRDENWTPGDFIADFFCCRCLPLRKWIVHTLFELECALDGRKKEGWDGKTVEIMHQTTKINCNVCRPDGKQHEENIRFQCLFRLWFCTWEF